MTPNQMRALLERNTKHGKTGTRTYRIWKNMKTRCFNPRTGCFRYYGGRGVTVCQQWRESFAEFVKDMGAAPPGMTLDRFPNKNGNYEPGNCRWATMKEQNNNRNPRTLRCECGHCETCNAREYARQYRSDVASGKRTVGHEMCSCETCRTCYTREWARRDRKQKRAS